MDVFDAIKAFFVESSWALPAFTASLALLVGLAVGMTTRRTLTRREEKRQADNVLQALERVLRGEPREAFDLLRREAEDNADASPALFFALAGLLRRLDMTERSAQVHRSLLARKHLERTDRIRAELGLAVDYLQIGHAELAEQLLRRLPRSVRKHPNLLTVRRRAALEARDWKEALESTSLMVRHGRQDKGALAEVYARMGVEALEDDDNRHAQRSFRRALRRSSDNLRARQGLAELYLKTGKRGRARKHLQRVVEANPALAPKVLPMLRQTSSSRTDQERYIKFLRRLARDEQAALWIGLEEAELLFAAGAEHNAACQSLLEKLLERYPRAVEVHEAYFNFLLQNQMDAEALRHLDRFLDVALNELKRFRCTHCGFTRASVFLSCPNCSQFGRVSYNLI